MVPVLHLYVSTLEPEQYLDLDGLDNRSLCWPGHVVLDVSIQKTLPHLDVSIPQVSDIRYSDRLRHRSDSLIVS